MQVYGTSKIYLIMATNALNEKLKGSGVEVFAAHPGGWPRLVHPPAAGHVLGIFVSALTLDENFMRCRKSARSVHPCTVVLAKLSLTLPAGIHDLESAKSMPC